jgi:hypothetical protein
MTEARDERVFQRAGASLRTHGARDADALAELLTTLRHEVAEPATDVAVSEPVMRLTSLRGRKRRPLVSRGTVRFIAGLAAGIAFAAGLGLGLFTGWRMRGESFRLAAEDLTVRGLGTSASMGLRPVQFMLVAPSATRVALVGEFNDWDATATPMVRAAGGAWHVALPLSSGRHVYAFVVDGSSWVADPQAPLAPERWYGARNSVLLVNAEQKQ